MPQVLVDPMPCALQRHGQRLANGGLRKPSGRVDQLQCLAGLQAAPEGKSTILWLVV